MAQVIESLHYMPRQLCEHRQSEKDYDDMSNYWCHMSLSHLWRGGGRAQRRIDKRIMKNDRADLKWLMITSGDDGKVRGVQVMDLNATEKWPASSILTINLRRQKGWLMVFIVLIMKGLIAALQKRHSGNMLCEHESFCFKVSLLKKPLLSAVFLDSTSPWR